MLSISCGIIHYTTPVAAGIAASSSRPIPRKSAPSASPDTRPALTFQKLLHKRLLRPKLRGQQDTLDMVPLLPAVEGLLVLLPPLQQQHINSAQIRDIAILLKVLPNRVPDVRGRNVQRIQLHDLRRLLLWREQTTLGRRNTDRAAPVAVEADGAFASLGCAQRQLSWSCKTGWYCCHCGCRTVRVYAQ